MKSFQKFSKPLVKPTMAPASHPLTAKVSLFAVLDQLAKPIAASYPQTQEFLGQYTGYTFVSYAAAH